MNYNLSHTTTTIMLTDKHIKQYLLHLSEQINGKYLDYTDDSIIFTMPIPEGRYQNIRGFLLHDQRGVFLQFCSKICALSDVPDLDFKALLAYNLKLIYGKLVVSDDDFLELVASLRYDLCTYEEVRTVLYEVGENADRLERELTGADVY
ncbi:MAG: hypothetical protein ACFCUI_13420 [Bernardetiaceae bacterium]